MPGRTADLEIKSPSIAEAAKLANVNGELAKLNAMAARRDKRNSSIRVSDSDWMPPLPGSWTSRAKSSPASTAGGFLIGSLDGCIRPDAEVRRSRGKKEINLATGSGIIGGSPERDMPDAMW